MPPKRKASEMEQPRPFEREDYQIGVVCALAIEEAAVHASLDGDKHPGLKPMEGDDNQYTFGRISGHNVVIACLPAGNTGTTSACNVATNMQRSFPIKFGLMVGIAGGVWSEENDVHLGDVIVSQPKDQFGGVVQYDFGKTVDGGTFKRTSSLDKPPKVLLQSLNSLKREHLIKGNKLAHILEAMFKKEPHMIKNFAHPGLKQDLLFDASYPHASGPKNCNQCDLQRVPPEWEPRSTTDPEIHYGIIASANQVMRDGPTRDKIAKDLNAICFEMEAAGLMNNFPCLVIRGICDYADTHKNKRWQGYAAFAAAAFAKELLGFIPSQEVVKMPPACKNKYWVVPRGSSALFTGRAGVVGKLEQVLRSSSVKDEIGQNRYVLVGMGGVGKSEICLKVAEIVRQSFWGVFWVDASSKATAESGFVDIGRVCSVPDPTFQGVKEWLAATDHNHKWLLIIDNADDESIDYASYFPSGNRGYIILTTRIPQCRIHNTVGCHDLENLEQREATELLLKAACIEPGLWESRKAAAQEVVQILGSHALAVIQAGAFVQMGLCTLEEYPMLFKERRQKLLQFRPTQAQSIYGDVYATFEVSAKHLENSPKKSARNALELLRFLAFVHFDNVPISIITRAWESSKEVDATKQEPLDPQFFGLTMWHVSKFPAFVEDLPNGKIDTIPLFEARAALASFSLISVGEATGNMTMHPLTHAWARDRLEYLESKEARSSASSVLALSTYREIDITDPFWFQLHPHVQSHLHAWDLESAVFPYPVLQCFFCFAQLFHRLEYDSEAEPVFQSIVDSEIFQAMADTYAKATTYARLAFCYNTSGKAMKARELLEEHIQVQGLRLDSEQPYAVDVYQELASTYSELGDNDKALEILEGTIHFQQKVQQEPEDSELANTYHALGLLYLDTGQPHKAIPRLEKAIEIGNALSGRRGHQMRSSELGLARAYLRVGKTDEATQLYEELWRYSKATLHKGHPYRIRTQSQLAQASIRKKEYHKAIELLEDVVEITKSTGVRYDHAEDLAARHNLGRAYLEAKEVDKAIDLLEEVVQIKKKVLKIEDRSLLLSQHELGRAYLEAGEVDKAIDLLEEVVQIKKNVLKIEDRSLLHSQHELGRAYLEAGEVDKGIDLLEEVVQIKKKVLKPGDRDLLDSQHELGRAYLKAGKVDKAIDLLEQVVQIEKNILKAEDRELLVSQYVLGRAYLDAGMTVDAIPLLQDIVQNGDASEGWMVEAKDLLEEAIEEEKSSQQDTSS